MFRKTPRRTYKIMSKFKRLYILLYIIFFSYYIGAGIVCAQEINQPDSLKNMVSEAYGSIRDSYFAGNNQGIVIHIQDLHCNYDAQMSIYSIIDELIDKYSLNLVATEGCVGKLDTAPFSNYADEEIKEIVAKYYIKTGEIDGPGFAHIMRKGSFSFWGVDDKKLHQDNIEAYKVSLKERAANLKYYNNIKSILDEFKSKVYSQELKELDDNIQAYKKEEMDFGEYITYLNALIEKHALKQKDHTNFTKLTSVLKKEADIDFLEVDNQRSEYVEKLSNELKKNDLSELLDKSLYFKIGKLGANEFYTYLETLSLREDTTPLNEEYSQLAKYIEYIKLYSTIDNIPLFEEIDSIEKSLKEKLFTTDIQRKVDNLSYTLDVVNDLFNLKLTKETLSFYRARRKESSASYFINFISENAPKYGIKYKFDPAFRSIDAELPSLEKFYQLAEERDSVLVENTVRKMKQDRAKLAVLVSGGFHTDGITKLLKEKDISYIVVTPKVSSLQADNPYTSALLGEKSEFDMFVDKMAKKLIE